MRNILVDEPLHPAIRALFPADWNLVFMTDNPNEMELAQIEAFFVYTHPIVDEALLKRMPKLKIIANFGVGTPHINKADALARGIPVTNTPGVLHHATAELTIGLLLAVTRHIVASHAHATGPDFTCYDPHKFWGLGLRGSTIGIIGMGEIGFEVARRMRHGFATEIKYHNRKPVRHGMEVDLDAEYVRLDTLLKISDVVVVMVPLKDDTMGMIRAHELSLMKRTAFLVNTSRGGVLDHDALVSALRNGVIAGAALDVTEPEPLPRDHPLLSMSNVVVTSHIGSATLQTRVAMGRLTINNINAVLEGRDPLNPVS